MIFPKAQELWPDITKGQAMVAYIVLITSIIVIGTSL